MDSVVNTDALLYVVIAKTLMAIVFLIIAAVAIKFGAHLFRRGLEVSFNEKNLSDHDVNVKRLTKDTWLPKGTLIKTKEKSDDDRFVKLEKDSWMSSGTLVLTPARDLETQLKLQIAGAVLMLSSLFWGWMSYLTSPLDVQSLNTALASSQEHKIRNLLGNLQGEVGTLLTNIRDLKQASDSNVKTDTLQTGLNQIGNVLTNQLSALQQEMGVMKSEMMTVKTQPQQLQQSMNHLSAQLQQLATDQASVKTGVENNQAIALQQTQQSIANLSTQIQQLVTDQVAITQQNLNAVKSGVENNQIIALQQTQQSIATLANQVQTSLDQIKQNQVDQNLQATLQTIQQDLGSLKTAVTDNSNNQELKISLGKTQEEVAHLQSLFQEIQSLKIMLGDLNKNQTEQLMNLHKELENKSQPVQIPAPIVEEIKNPVLNTLIAPESKYIDIPLVYNAGKSKPSDLKPLVTLGEALQSPQLKGKEILLQGYTDDKGDEEANRAISQKRADYIKGYLVKNYGLDAAKIQTEGKGQDDPIVSNKTVEGRAQNRRIRVSVR
jgi:outer membrane protein OmpA-like peptidoglycan-associated protein